LSPTPRLAFSVRIERELYYREEWGPGLPLYRHEGLTLEDAILRLLAHYRPPKV